MTTPNKKGSAKHTPLPWTYEGGDNSSIEITIGETTCSVSRYEKNTGNFVIEREEMEANAELIVTAVNNYHSLVEQNKHLNDQLDAGANQYAILVGQNERLKEALTAAQRIVNDYAVQYSDEGYRIQELVEAALKAAEGSVK